MTGVLAACPRELACPLTGVCMQDPVMAADGHTYERQAIQTWLARHQISPRTRKLLETKDVYPHHEKRSEIERWKTRAGVRAARSVRRKSPSPRAHRNSSIVDASLQARLGKLTWASSPAEVLRELDQLSQFITQNAVLVLPSQLGRLRGCLSTAPELWSDEVDKSLKRLEAQAGDPAEPRQRKSCSSASGLVGHQEFESVPVGAQEVDQGLGGAWESCWSRCEDSTDQACGLGLQDTSDQALLDALESHFPEGWEDSVSVESLGGTPKRRIEAIQVDDESLTESKTKACKLQSDIFSVEDLLSFDYE